MRSGKRNFRRSYLLSFPGTSAKKLTTPAGPFYTFSNPTVKGNGHADKEDNVCFSCPPCPSDLTGLSGCANQTGSEAGALLSQDIRKMDNDEPLLYYYRLTKKSSAGERSGPASSVGIGIGGGGWGRGVGGGVGISTSAPCRGRCRRTSQPPRRGPCGNAASGHESAVNGGAWESGVGSRSRKRDR